MANTPRNRFDQMATGSNVNTWGTKTNKNLARIDECLDGTLPMVVSGDRALVYANDDTDEAHYGFLNITGGTGGRIIIQPQQGTWIVRNNAAADILFTIDGSTGTVVNPNTTTAVMTDGTTVWQIGPSGASIKAYVDAGLAVERAYAESLSFAGASGSFPGQAGNAGRFLSTDGTNPLWKLVEITDVNNLSTTLDDLVGLSIVFATVL